MKYDPYGMAQNSSNGAAWPATRFGYTGQVVLSDAQLYYYKARVYDPKLGRFLQIDPVGSKDDLVLYNYVGGDPVNRSDPTGLYYCEAGQNYTRCTEEMQKYYDELVKSLSGLKKGSDEYNRVGRVIGYLGAPGQDGTNGRVDIRLGVTSTGGLAEASGTNLIILDKAQMRRMNKAFGAASAAVGAGVIGHETQHLVNEFDRHSPRPNYQRSHEFKDEVGAYTTESYILQGLREGSTSFWRPGMTSEQRERAIKDGAEESTKMWCKASVA